MFCSGPARRLVFISAFCLAALDPLAATAVAASPSITVSPKAGPPTSKVSVSGTGFHAGESVEVLFDAATVASGTTDGVGAFSGVSFHVPGSTLPGTHTVKAVGKSSGLSAERSLLVRTNWPQRFFSARQNPFNPYENVINRSNVSRLAVGKTVTFADSPRVEGLIVANGLAYLGSSNGKLYAVNAETGTLRWTVTTGASTGIAPVAVSGGSLYVHSDAGSLSALNASTGATRWTLQLCARRPGVTVENAVLYVICPWGYLVAALDGSTGATLWTGSVESCCPPYWSAVANGILYATSGVDVNDYGRLYAFNASTGANLFTKRPSLGADLPVVVNGRIYVTGEEWVRAYKATTGASLWSRQGASPTVANGIAYSTWSKAGVLAYDAATGAGVWAHTSSTTQDPFWAPGFRPIVANGVLYLHNGSDGKVYALATANGATLWSSALPAYPHAVVNGHVYATHGNTLHVFSVA